jgi:hypothetical protein
MNERRELRATAYHEAGHAVMRLELGRGVTRATVKPEGEALGRVRHRPSKLDTDYPGVDWPYRRWAETEVMTLLAGPEAEEQLIGRRNDVGASSDDAKVLEIAVEAEGYGEERRDAYLEWLRLKVRDFVAHAHFWIQVEAVAAALLERETLTGAEIRQICRRALRLGEVSINRPLFTDRSRNIGYAWSLTSMPESPDVVGTFKTVRGVMERVHRELEGTTRVFERLFVGDKLVDDEGGARSVEDLFDEMESQAAQRDEWARQG